MVPVQSTIRNLIWKFSTLEQIFMIYDRAKAIHFRLNTGSYVTGNQKFYRTQFPLLSKGKFTRDENKTETRDGTVIKRKTNQSPSEMIHLFYDNEEHVLPIEEARKIAKVKKLSLVKKTDSNQSSSMKFYELVEDHQLMKQQSPDNWKNVKTYIFSSGINEHDVKVKIKSILKYLNKNEKLKCVVKNSSDKQVPEHIINLVKQGLSESDIPHELRLEPSAQFVQILIRKAESN